MTTLLDPDTYRDLGPDEQRQVNDLIASHGLDLRDTQGIYTDEAGAYFDTFTLGSDGQYEVDGDSIVHRRVPITSTLPAFLAKAVTA